MDISAYQKIGEIPYDFTHKRLSVAVAKGTDRFLIAKGTLTNVLAVCAKTESAGGTIADIHPTLEQIQFTFRQTRFVFSLERTSFRCGLRSKFVFRKSHYEYIASWLKPAC